MNVLANEWPIKQRADSCGASGRPFVAGEQFYTLLFHDGDGFRRHDLSKEAWASRNENIRPFSFWKSRYELPPAVPRESLPKENAENLLRRLLSEDNPEHANTCYVLAVMLERKRILKQIKREEVNGEPVLIYEHRKNGDVFIIRDPQLRLTEIESVQQQISALLNTATPSTP